MIDFRERLKMELRLQGSSLAKISHQLSVSQSAVSSVARRRNRSEPIETAIADALGKTVEELFGEIDRLVARQKEENARLKAGQKRARPQRKKLGPPGYDEEILTEIVAHKDAEPDISILTLARLHGVSRSVVYRALKLYSYR